MSNRLAMPERSITCAKLPLVDTTAVLSPASRNSRTQAMDPGKTSTPIRCNSSSTSARSRLPSPQTETSSGRESGVPSESSIPRAARNPRTLS